MNFLVFKFKSQSGQTLIETMVAIFILVMGVSSAVGLALYAFNSSSTVTKQIIATGLAREGLESVKNMRDTNWLLQTSIDNNCYDFASSTAMDANCYHNWLGKNGAGNYYCINPSPGNSCNGNDTTDTYFLGFDGSQISSNSGFWILNKDSSKFGLDFNSVPGNNGFYSPHNVGIGSGGTTCSNGSSDYCRRIIISKLSSSTTPPAPTAYDPANSGGAASPGPLVLVQSQVWWVDKKCPKTDTWPGLGSCSVELDTYLTNWKNF